MAENKKTLTVTQQVKELVYDIQNKAYLTGQAREAAGKSYQVASNMQASDDDENSYQIRRSLANAFSSLKSLLGEYLNEDNTTSDNLMDEEIDNNGKLSLEFLLPSNYNNASADALKWHTFISCRYGTWRVVCHNQSGRCQCVYTTLRGES